MQPRTYRPAFLALALFVLWTAAARVSLSQGRAESAWAPRPFADWPSSFGVTQGTGRERFSIYLIGSGLPSPEPLAQASIPVAPAHTLIGNAAVGASVDQNDSNYMNGARFRAGAAGGSTEAGFVYVRRPIEPSPHNQFQLAIYDDANGAPARLVARSVLGTITGEGWNTVSITANLKPDAYYWLIYNSNGSNGAVNNLAFDRADADPITRAIQAPHAALFDRLSTALGVVVTPLVAGALTLLLALCLGRKNLLQVAALAVAFGLGLFLEAVLKRWLFYPVAGSYPGGHALRAAFLAVLVCQLLPRRTIIISAVALTAAVCLSRIYVGEHYWYEVIGGALAGFGLAVATLPAGVSFSRILHRLLTKSQSRGRDTTRNGVTDSPESRPNRNTARPTRQAGWEES